MKYLVIYQDDQGGFGSAILEQVDPEMASSDNPVLWGLHNDLEIIAVVGQYSPRIGGDVNFESDDHRIWLTGVEQTGSDLLAYQAYEPAPATSTATAEKIESGEDEEDDGAGPADPFNESDPTRPIGGDNGESAKGNPSNVDLAHFDVQTKESDGDK